MAMPSGSDLRFAPLYLEHALLYRFTLNTVKFYVKLFLFYFVRFVKRQKPLYLAYTQKN